MTWDDIAEYSGFLSNIFVQGFEASETPQAKGHFDLVSEKMVNYMGTLDGDEAARQASAFQMLRDRKVELNSKSDKLRGEIKSFANL